MKNDIQKILLSEEDIRTRIAELGLEIDRHYEDKEILIVTLLDGAIVFTADLIRNLSIPLRLDCMRVSSYGDSTDPETAPRILSSLKTDVSGKHVLLVDDILDTGNTMKRVHEEVMVKNPASVHSCVFLRAGLLACRRPPSASYVRPASSCRTASNRPARHRCCCWPPHLDFQHQRDEPHRFSTGTIFHPLFFARPPLKSLLRRKAPP